MNKVLLKIVGMGLLMAVLSACSYPIAFQELDYDLAINKRPEKIIVVIDQATLDRTVSIRSMKAGLLNRWDAQAGTMLKQIADIVFPQMFTEYVFSSAAITLPTEGSTFVLQMTIPEFQFKHGHTYFTVGISVFDEQSKLLEKEYKEEGVNQGSKMTWTGVFGMKSAVRQSSLDALKKIFIRIREDVFDLLEKKQLKSQGQALQNSQPLQDSVEDGNDDMVLHKP